MRDDFQETAAQPSKPGPRPVITLDVALYERHLEASDMTDEQKREFLEMLWSIIVGFVDLGFGIDPLEQARPVDSFGQFAEIAGPDDADVASSSDHQPSKPDTTPSLRTDIQSALRKGRRA